MGKLTSKEIYSIFLLHKTPEILSKFYWSNYAFNGIDFNWDTWYLYNFQNNLTPRKSIDFSWKLFHGLLETESKLKTWRKSDGVCRSCRTLGYVRQDQGEIVIENANHLLTSCSYRPKVWTMISQLIKEVFGHTIAITRLEIMTGYFRNDLDQNSCRLINMILSMSRYNFWLSRNLIKHENNIMGFKEFYLRLKHYILTHIQTLESSNTTDNIIKDKLSQVRDSLNTIFTSDVDENRVPSLF